MVLQSSSNPNGRGRLLPEASRFTYESGRLPRAFSGFVVAHISDLHNRRFGAGQKTLLDKLRAIAPDLVAVTGDIVDRRRFDLAPALEFAEGAAALAPVFYVPGNHEAHSGKFEMIRRRLAGCGARVLFDEAAEIHKDGARIRLLGLSDPAFHPGVHAASGARERRAPLLMEGGFTVLLAHRPELFKAYCALGIDLVFAGHAHGGQFRLPGVGGLFAPHQGFFPKYTAGRYDEGGAAMFVSRGLGNSAMPIRIFNPPEIVVVELKGTRGG